MDKKNEVLLSVVILTKNEEAHIADCISSVSFANEIIVIDSGSKDNTIDTARNLNATVYHVPFKNFAYQRNQGLEKAKGKWILYIDADERVTEALKTEIKDIIVQEDIQAYKIPRKNMYFKKYCSPHIEYMERLFLKSALKEWRGDIHESPVFSGPIGTLHHELLHSTHTDLERMLEKTNDWSIIDSSLLYNSGHPPMKVWRFARIMITTFIDSYIGKSSWKMGTPGIIESMFQAYSYFIVYVKLWERQQKKADIHAKTDNNKL